MVLRRPGGEHGGAGAQEEKRRPAPEGEPEKETAQGHARGRVGYESK